MLNTTLAQVDEFRACVLKHIHEQLPAEEWIWLRGQGEAQLAGLNPIAHEDIGASPEQLVAKHVHEASLRVIDVLRVFTGKVIDEISGQPVYYCQKTGIYLWGKSPEDGFILSFWITDPAYPPGW